MKSDSVKNITVLDELFSQNFAIHFFSQYTKNFIPFDYLEILAKAIEKKCKI